jgi:hypothetical protein
MGLSARFQIVAEECDENRVVIRDIGPWNTYSTITNDAERVVLEMHLHFALGRKRLLYYDSDRNLDELVHDGEGRFVGLQSARDVKALMTMCPGELFHDFTVLTQVGGSQRVLYCKRCGFRKDVPAKGVNP